MKPFCHDVTHAFLASYVHVVDFAKLKEANVPLFQTFLLAVDECSKSLQRVVLHTGGKVRASFEFPSPSVAGAMEPQLINTCSLALWSSPWTC